MKNPQDVSVSDVIIEAARICRELIDKDYPPVAVSLIGHMIEVSSGVVISSSFSDHLLEEQVNMEVRG